MNCGSPWSWNSPFNLNVSGEVKMRKYHVEASASFQYV
jgi:hypothetical protein